jgi:hypothetical protein
MVEPLPLDAPVALLAGERASQLTALFGFVVTPGVTVTLTPPSVTSQWYVDNPGVTDANEAVWFTLSDSERRVLTRNEIKLALSELKEAAVEARRQMMMERQRVMQQRQRSPLIDTIPALAAQAQTADEIYKTLRRTFTELDQIHARLLFKYRRPAMPGEKREG